MTLVGDYEIFTDIFPCNRGVATGGGGGNSPPTPWLYSGIEKAYIFFRGV